MELRHLEYVVAIADERHFTRAARRLHVAQSGLSAAVRALETELGTSLFLRTTRHVELTEAGRAFVVEARRTLAAARAAAEAVRAVDGLERGTLTLGIMQALTTMNFGGLLVRFHRRYPGIDLRLCRGSSADLVPQVSDGRLDLAFTSSPSGHPALLSVSLFDSRLVVVCARTHPLARRGAVPLDELSQGEFVEFPPSWGTRALVDQMFAAAGMERRVRFEVGDAPLLLDLVEAGLGIAVVPEILADSRPDLVKIRMAGEEVSWTAYAIALDPGPVNPAGRALLALAMQTWRTPGRLIAPVP
jgi:DNA-binding transcriptional LysR family regulator